MDTTLFKPLIDSLHSHGYAIQPNFLDAFSIMQLARECRRLDHALELTPSAVGRGKSRQHISTTRGDRTYWFNPCALSEPQAVYWRVMESLRIALNRSLLLGLDELEAHYALYPPGTSYARHRDCFRDHHARVLSSVCYLNADWHANDGGVLRLYLDSPVSKTLDIPPNAGTLVLFLSAEFEHEVLAASRDRISIAGWYKQRTGDLP